MMGSLFGIPLSLIGTAFGALTGWLTKNSAMRAEVVASERKHQLDAMVAVTSANTAAVDDEIRLLEAKSKFETEASKADPHRSEARRYIAYAIVACVAFIIPAMVTWGDMGWFSLNSYELEHWGFFGIGGWTEQVQQVVQAAGLPLIWLDGMMTVLGTTVAFYMGGSAAKFRNPYTQK